MSKWLLSSMLFLFFYRIFKYNSKEYDPSGHCCGMLITMSCYLCNALYPHNNQRLSLITWSIYVLMLAHTLFSLFFTCYVYHTVAESIVGLAFGYLIFAACFLTDLYSSAMHDICSFVKTNIRDRIDTFL